MSKESWNRLLPGILFDVGVSHHPYLDLDRTGGAGGSMAEVEGSDSTKYGKSFLSAGGGLSIRYEQAVESFQFCMLVQLVCYFILFLHAFISHEQITKNSEPLEVNELN